MSHDDRYDDLKKELSGHYIPVVPIDRDSELYLEPNGRVPGKDFANCRSCTMFMRAEGRCMILPKDLEVGPNDSCGLYVPGKREEHNTMTPEEVGFVKDQNVRCENCVSFDGIETCNWFKDQNTLGQYQSNEKVIPSGCCNAFRPEGV